jgi:hypothetical protein
VNIGSESALVEGIGPYNRTPKAIAEGKLEHYGRKLILVPLQEDCMLPSGVLNDQGWGGVAILWGDRGPGPTEDPERDNLEIVGVLIDWVQNVGISIPMCLSIDEMISNG